MNNPLGASWKSSVTGLITLATGAISFKPEIIAFLPDTLEHYLIGISNFVVFVSGGAFVLSVKDRNVTGGTVQQDATGKIAVPQVATPMPPDPALPDLPPDKPKVVRVKLTKKVKPRIKVPPRIT
jgi:hypothetical protein